MRKSRNSSTNAIAQPLLGWLSIALFTAGCTSSVGDLKPTMLVDGTAATVDRQGDIAIVTLDTKNPSDFEGQQALVSNAIEAAGVLTGCYVAPAPRRELDAYVAGAEPVRIAVDLQCF